MAVIGGVISVLWVEQFWNFHLRKLDHEIFEDGPSAKIGSLENFRLYGRCARVLASGVVYLRFLDGFFEDNISCKTLQFSSIGMSPRISVTESKFLRSDALLELVKALTFAFPLRAQTSTRHWVPRLMRTQLSSPWNSWSPWQWKTS